MSSFEKNVFINCPYDDEYLPLLKSLIFTIKACGFVPRIALERFNSAEVRLQKIKQLIEESNYSIHDLSRIKAVNAGEYFRLNMALELGMDIGCRDYHPEPIFREKKLLVLESERFSVQKGLSDMSFGDCKSHEGSEGKLIKCVRDWFYENGTKKIKPASAIWNDFNVFMANLYVEKTAQGFKKEEIDNILVPEFIDWIDERFNGK
jgi:hypothetical protein